MVDLAPQAALQTEAAAKPSIRRYYVLALLTVIYALNFLDRTIFNVLIEPIKKEFALSDTTMGLLAGFGFVLFYSLLGIPIARLADRFNRRNIVAVALAFWSAMTVFCGMAQSVATLALARIGVGIGESGGTPASQSIIADLFNKNDRPRALGVYAIGTYLGVFLGYFIGGYINQYYGWRMAFYVAGLPGIALAALQNARNGHDIAAVEAVGEARDRDAEQRIEQHEAKACQQVHRGVAERELLFDRLDQDVEDGAVEEVQRIDDGQQAKHVISPDRGPCGGLRLNSRLRREIDHACPPMLFSNVRLKPRE
jgi:sugar phosphate permease